MKNKTWFCIPGSELEQKGRPLYGFPKLRVLLKDTVAPGSFPDEQPTSWTSTPEESETFLIFHAVDNFS